MESENPIESKVQRPLKLLISDETVIEKFRQMLGENAVPFLMTVLNSTQNNKQLANADPQSILLAAGNAAALDLPVDPNLGLAYIVPYKDGNRYVAQFQIGWKGLVALCHRSHDFIRIHADTVHEGEYKGADMMTGDYFFERIQDNDLREKTKVIGVMAYFRLKNGFEKSFYMTDAQVMAHAKKYSKAYGANSGEWVKNPIPMKKKTVLKLLLEKFAPKSVKTSHLQKGIITDQAVIEDFEGNKIRYIDNEEPENAIDLASANATAERNRIIGLINMATTQSHLDELRAHVPDEEVGLMWLAKEEEISKPKSNV